MRRFLLLFAACQLSLLASPITALLYTADGSALLHNTHGGIVASSAGSGEKTYSLRVARITSLALNPGGDLLAAGGGVPGQRGELLLMDWPSARVRLHLTNHQDIVTSVAFSNDGALMASASADNLAHVYKIENGKPGHVFTLEGHAGDLLDAAFSPTGKTIVSASADRSIKVWSPANGKLLRSFSHHTEPVHALAFRPATGEAPATLASASDDRTVRIWQPEIGRMVRIIRHHPEPVFALAWSPDGKTLYSAGKDGQIRAIDGDSDTILKVWPAHKDWIYALAIHPRGSQLASGDWTGALKVWPLP